MSSPDGRNEPSLLKQSESVPNGKDITTGSINNQIKSNVMSDKFWAEDKSILFRSDRAIEFFPTADMSVPEKLNAITRFFIYLGIILFLVYKNTNMLYVPAIAIAIIYMIYKNDKQVQQVNIEKFDSDIKRELGIQQNTPIAIDDVGDVCQQPTRDNPFMNVLVSDITENANRPPGCYSQSQDVKQQIENYFNYNLYKDVEDIWDKRNSQRQFTSMPWTTIPNDADTFMKWCWNTPFVCKDGDQDYCMSITSDDALRRPGYT